MWISFLPGIGYDKDPPPPSLENVEEHINNPSPDEKHAYDKKPLVFVAFSISATEPRMMVLRNLVGKLMAWCNDQKIFLKPRPWQVQTDEKDRQLRLIDMFQDEGNRVGCYALWDSFTDLVDNADLKFIEDLADEMTNMTATSESLAWTKEWTKEDVVTHIANCLRVHYKLGDLDAIEGHLSEGFELNGEQLVSIFQEEEEDRMNQTSSFLSWGSRATGGNSATAQNKGRFETLLHMIGIEVGSANVLRL